MGRKFIPDEASPFYPPRARWYSPVFYVGSAIHRSLALDRLRLPRDIKAGALVAGFFVPGLAVWLRGPRLWGQVALGVSAALILIFIAWLGYPAANLAFGLLISLHATGLVYYCSPALAGEPLRSRLAFTFLVLLAIGLLLYMPSRNFVQSHWLTPLRMNGQVIVVERSFQAGRIQRGDWMAYRLFEEEQGEAHNGGAVRVNAGAGLGPVLALAGDRVVFSTNAFSVNGISHANLPHMPVAGEFTVLENHWFIWPNLDISGHGNVGEGNISGTMLSMASVGESQFLGRPLHRWFWRKQIVP